MRQTEGWRQNWRQNFSHFSHLEVLCHILSKFIRSYFQRFSQEVRKYFLLNIKVLLKLFSSRLNQPTSSIITMNHLQHSTWIATQVCSSILCCPPPCRLPTLAWDVEDPSLSTSPPFLWPLLFPSLPVSATSKVSSVTITIDHVL